MIDMGKPIEEGMDALIGIGIGVFVLIIFLIMAYSAAVSSTQSLSSSLGTFSATNTLNPKTVAPFANNDVGSGSNTLVVNLAGSYGWISSAYPITITITGNSISSYATNTAYATPGPLQTQKYTLTGATTPQTLSSTAGNFFNISAILVSGVTPAAYPNMNVQIVQTYNAVAYGSVPASYATNTLSANDILTITLPAQYGIVENMSLNTQTPINTFGSNVVLVIFALVLIVIVIAVLKMKKKNNEGGFLK
jgi:hypothetical protein